MADHVLIDEAHSELVLDLVFRVANPEINEELTTASVSRMIEEAGEHRSSGGAPPHAEGVGPPSTDTLTPDR